MYRQKKYISIKEAKQSNNKSFLSHVKVKMYQVFLLLVVHDNRFARAYGAYSLCEVYTITVDFYGFFSLLLDGGTDQTILNSIAFFLLSIYLLSKNWCSSMWEKSIVAVLQSRSNIYRNYKKKRKQIWKRAYK